jgi:hypothetical protein
MLEKLKKENGSLKEDNRVLQGKVDTMKAIMIQFDHQRLDDIEED